MSATTGKVDRGRRATFRCSCAAAEESMTAPCLERTVACSIKAASGIVYGRNVIQHSKPAGITAALMARAARRVRRRRRPRASSRQRRMTARTVNIAIIGAGLMGREIAAAIQRWPALIDHPVRPRLTRGVRTSTQRRLDWFDGIERRDVRKSRTTHALLLGLDDRCRSTSPCGTTSTERIYLDAIGAGKEPARREAVRHRSVPPQRRSSSAPRRIPRAFVRCSSEMPFFPGAQRAIDYVSRSAP